jgi:hypothetical protein
MGRVHVLRRQFLESQLDDNGHCTMCRDARTSYNADGIPAGRPCCRRYLSECRKEGRKA